MKKLIAILLTAAMILSFAACAEKTDPEMIVQKGENGQWDITGTWKIIDKKNTPYYSTSVDGLYIFYPDGTYYSSSSGETARYRVSGSIFIDVIDGGSNIFGLSVEGDTMTWKKGLTFVTFKRISLDTTKDDH